MGNSDQIDTKTLPINDLSTAYNELRIRAGQALADLLHGEADLLAVELQDTSGQIICRRADPARQVGLLLDPLRLMRHALDWQGLPSMGYLGGVIRHSEAHQIYAGIIALPQLGGQLELAAKSSLSAQQLHAYVTRWLQQLLKAERQLAVIKRRAQAGKQATTLH